MGSMVPFYGQEPFGGVLGLLQGIHTVYDMYIYIYIYMYTYGCKLGDATVQGMIRVQSLGTRA